jgi:8-oxo-dGTP pyrophosphatase MutT (NUDIX family)
VTREEVREAFEEAGWRISDRTAYEVLVGEAEGYPSLSLLAREEEAIGAYHPAFEIVHREGNATLRVRSIPTPRQAAALIEERGGPLEEG